MEILSNPVVATVIFLGILVFVHEAGHFLVGKLCGIPVEIFSIGFGPSLFNFNRNKTNYRISIIPLGGFVKFYGMVPSEPVPEHIKGREFYRAPLLARLATIAAGPIANFLLGVVAFALIGMIGMQHPKAIVGEIMPGSPAEKSGLQFMDVITAVNGEPIRYWRDLERVISENPMAKLQVKVKRSNGSNADLTIVPEAIEDKNLAKTKGRIGISPNFIPPILTVIEKGPAAAAGLKTGDRVKSITWNGVSAPLKYYRQMLEILNQPVKTPQTELVFSVESLPSQNGDSAAQPEIKDIAIDISGISFENSSELVGKLGLSDSQLTIDDPDKESSVLQRGDYLVSWNDQPIGTIFGLNEIIVDNRLPEVRLTIIRNGETMVVKPQLKPVDVQKIEGKVTIYTLAVTFLGSLEQGELIEERYTNPIAAVNFGISETFSKSSMIAGAVIGLFTGDMPLKALGGPIAIAKVASDSVKLGFLPFLNILALISINLGLLNLIPIPILDGGQLLLIGAEGIARKPLPESAIEGFQKIGFVMILALIAMVTYNDLGRFWASMMQGFSTLF